MGRDDGSVEDGWIPNYPLLEEWVSQDGDPVENPQQSKLFIGGEFSTNASDGRAARGQRRSIYIGARHAWSA